MAHRGLSGIAVGLLLSAGSAGAATPEIGYWDNWTDASGVSHLTRCALHRFVMRSASAPSTPEWQDVQPAAARVVQVHVEPPGWDGGWHENPAVQWIVPLAGTWFVQAMDGSRIAVGPGDVVVGEDGGARPDAAGHRGHLSRNPGTVPVSLMIVQMGGLPPTSRPCRFD